MEKKYVVMEGPDFRQTLIDVMMGSINSTMQMNYTTMVELKSLWFPEYKKKYVLGSQVVIENGILIHSSGEVPTHEITKLEGTLADNKHRITLLHLSNNEVKTIEL